MRGKRAEVIYVLPRGTERSSRYPGPQPRLPVAQPVPETWEKYGSARAGVRSMGSGARCLSLNPGRCVILGKLLASLSPVSSSAKWE